MERYDIEKRKLTLDDLAHVDEKSGVEYWYARDIMGFLGYQRWENFAVAVERAKVSGNASKTAGEDHFREVTKMVELGSGSKRKVKDHKLTRYACYLIAQNGDPRKEEIATGCGRSRRHRRPARKRCARASCGRAVKMSSPRGLAG